MTLRPQYGVSGYRIDFVVAHPSIPDRWVLAIECDGATYHSAQSARDRDRLRQEHLERLGWKFHRIWSTEWFKKKPDEVDRAWRALQDAISTEESIPAVLLLVTPASPDGRLGSCCRGAEPPLRGQRPYVPDRPRRSTTTATGRSRGWFSVDQVRRPPALRRTSLLSTVMDDLGFEAPSGPRSLSGSRASSAIWRDARSRLHVVRTVAGSVLWARPLGTDRRASR